MKLHLVSAAMCVGYLCCTSLLRCQAQTTPSVSSLTCPSTPEPITKSQSIGPLDILSDTHEFDFKAYTQGLVLGVKEHWYQLIPSEARAPQVKSGKVSIEFSILKSGQIEGVRAVKCSGSSALDRAAFSAIVSSAPFLPLPDAFSGGFVRLRFNFFYNPVTWAITSTNGTPTPAGIYIPCPNYPIQAERDNKQGTVILSLVVRKDGKVGHVKVTQRAGRHLDSAAKDIVKTWVFKITLQNGKPVEVPLSAEIAFHLG